MKPAVLLIALVFAMAKIGVANAQSAAAVVAPAVSAETSRAISDAVSKSANDALKPDRESDGAIKKTEKAAGNTEKIEDGIKKK